MNQAAAPFQLRTTGPSHGICRVDQGGRIVAANPTLVSMLGYQSQEEVVGLEVTDLECAIFEGNERTRQTVPESASASRDAEWKRKDGTSIPVRLTSRSLVNTSHSDAAGFEITVEDMSELAAVQRPLRLDLETGPVAGVAKGPAHDLNNLLMIIESYAQLLEDSSNDLERVVEYAKKIHDASLKAASVTHQLLARSPNSTQEPAREPTVLDLNQVVSEQRKTLPRMIRENVVVQMELDPQLGKVSVHRNQLEQIITSLVVHANDSMLCSGRITIETRNVRIDAADPVQREFQIQPGPYAMLAVWAESDICPGAVATSSTHISELSSPSNQAKKGASLALHLVARLVKRNHGYVRGPSETDQCGVVRVYLPRLEIPAVERGADATGTVLKGRETILLVEDEASLREVTRTYLQSKGYVVLEASDSDKALTICKEYGGPIHVLLSDVVLPGLGGLELAKAAGELRAGLRVILTSGFTDKTQDEEVAKVMASFLHKPFTLDVLARKVRSVIDQRRDLAEAG